MTDVVDIEFTVNGQKRRGRCESRVSLADFLREELNLTGTHIGCEHGVCGVCTVMVDGVAMRSCIMFAVQAQGMEIRTIEGLAGPDGYHPLQQAFHENHALQCGFCTPGMLIAALDFLNTNGDPTEEETREALSAVLCRCTGYQNIVKAVMAAAPAMRARQA
jgi:aerobic carbon-monoxide dehydrogenase small subunit